MSYLFGQFRSAQQDDYLENLSNELNDLTTISALSEDVLFTDKRLSLINNSFSPTDSKGVVKSYYLNIKIKKQQTEQKIKIKLINSENNNQQEIDIITVPSGSTNEYKIYSCVISPKLVYNKIDFILERNMEDYNIVGPGGYYGRTLNIEIISISDIINVIDYISAGDSSIKKLKQIGVQSNPGLLMSIQGEPIRVGRTGQYEINNGISINYIGFIFDKNVDDYFILDYQY